MRSKPRIWADKATALLMAAAIVAASAPMLPRGFEAASLAAHPEDETAGTDYQLSRLSDDDYEAAIRKALARGDANLADSLRVLADQQAVALPALLSGEVDAALAEEHSRIASDAWDGFLSGNAENEPALAGAIAADLSGYGDIRDLYSQAGNYVDGIEVDTTTVALAAVGLTLTVATVV